MKKFDQAKEYYKKVAELDPNDPETYYSLAVIDWMQAYQPDQTVRASLGMKPTDELKDKKACAELKDEERAEGRRRHSEPAEGAAASSRLRRRHGVSEPAVSPARRVRVRQS